MLLCSFKHSAVHPYCLLVDNICNVVYCYLVMVLFNVSVFLGLSEGNATVAASFMHESGSTECSVDPACLRCSPGKGCLKCAVLITQPDRRCVSTCPGGARAQWSTRTDYMGRVCVQYGGVANGESFLLGMSSDGLTVLTGIVAGSVLCVLIISFAIVYVRYKKKNFERSISETSSELDETNHSMTHQTGQQQQQRRHPHTGLKRHDFLQQLDLLRPHAPTFLCMLNSTRQQLREAHRAGGGNTAVSSAYRPVICDLAKILILLNKRPETFISGGEFYVMPSDDWEQLFQWAQKNLQRYIRLSDVSQPEVAQLINFLQTPPITNDTERSDKEITNNTINMQVMSTFKPDQSIGSTLSLQDVAVKNFNANYSTAQTVLNPQWKFDFALAASTNLPISQFNPNIWKNSSNHYFLDDDFGQLGFRPQDEITTEL